MSGNLQDRPRCGWPGTMAVVLLSLGYLGATVLGDGFEFHRSVFVMPVIVAAALCGLVESWRTGRVLWKPALFAGGLALLYLVCRSLTSPVWDLARHDLLLATLFWLTVVTVATCATTSMRLAILALTIALILGLHFVVGLYQHFGDSSFAVFRISRREGAGVSGLFWHWNNLSAVLAIVVPVVFGVAVYSRTVLLRLVFGFLFLAGLYLAYLTKSRAGLVALMVGLGAVGFGFLLGRFRSSNWSIRLAIVAGVGCVTAVAVILSFGVVSKVSEQRKQGGDLNLVLEKDMRFALAGLAFDQWMEKPLVGTGSQSFRYLSVEHWDRETMPRWLGTPDTVHNEYLQTLAEYGLIGFLLLVLFVMLVFGRFVLWPPEEERSGSVWTGARIGGFGGLTAAAIHAMLDFQMHVLPVLLLAGGVVGLLVSTNPSTSKSLRWVHMLTIVFAGTVALASSGRDNLSLITWLKWETAAVRQEGRMTGKDLSVLRKLVDGSPHYILARAYGRFYMEAYLKDSNRNPKLLEEALWALEIAYHRNPFDQEASGNYGLVLDLVGRHEEATAVHLRTVEMAWRRESRYGVMSAMSHHLYQVGEKIWKQRKAEKALGFFLVSLDYLNASHRQGFRFDGGLPYKERKRLLESRVSLLQTSGITPQFPQEIPPPPGES